MDTILVLAHRIPYPPDKGDKIRTYHVIRHLAARYRVHLGCFVDDPNDWRHAETLRGLCADTYFAPIGAGRMALAALTALHRKRALSIAAYDHPGMAAWVRGAVNRHRPAGIYAVSSAMAQFVHGLPGNAVPTVIDFVDMDADKWRLRAAQARWPQSWVFRREAACILDHDRAASRRFDHCLFVSQSEADKFCSAVPDAADKVRCMPNGIDGAYFTPQSTYPDPFAGAPTLVFTGTMGYWPNQDAVSWFATDVLPVLRRDMPTLGFAVVGRAPGRAVRRLARREGVRIVGAVSDVRPYLAHALAVVAPLRHSPGVANKILEGMAMAKPVVATSQALAGLPLRPGEDVLLANSAVDFRRALAPYYADPAPSTDLGERARSRVLRDFAWSAALTGLDELFSEKMEGHTSNDGVLMVH